jgi:hypothetical protein
MRRCESQTRLFHFAVDSCNAFGDYKEETMSNRRRLARERLEYYLVYLILAYRHLILIVGLLLSVYAIATIFADRIAGFIVLLPAIFLFLLGSSYNAIVYTARLGAWIGTLWRHDD